MAVPSTGPLPINAIVDEFGGSIPHSLSEYYRGGGLVPDVVDNDAIPTTGNLPMNSFYGAKNRIAINIPISSPQVDYNTYSNRSPAYVAGISDLTYTISPGVTINASSRTADAFSVPSGFNSGDTVTIVNNGAIRGSGGPGGAGGGSFGSGTPGEPGGRAVLIQRPVSFRNNNTIAGGGGGGGGGGGFEQENEIISPRTGGGGGGGGGAGIPAGAGGGRGASSPFTEPGTPGSTTGGGSGGFGGPTAGPSPSAAGDGGNGGGAGQDGATGNVFTGTQFDRKPSAGTGGTRGYYITGSSFTTWLATGTRLGRSN